MVSACGGWGTQRANPGAPAAQYCFSPVPRGPSTQWATTGAPDVFCGTTSVRRGSGTPGTNLGGPCLPFPPHGWSAPGEHPLLLRKQPIWAAGDTPHLMPVEQGLPWQECSAEIARLVSANPAPPPPPPAPNPPVRLVSATPPPCAPRQRQTPTAARASWQNGQTARFA